MGEDSISLTSTVDSISEVKDELEEKLSPDNLMNPLSSTQHVAVGVYLVIAGILTIVGNASVIGAFIRFRNLLSSPYRLLCLHLCTSDISMAILAGFLMSGSSSLAGRWLFGDKGCQYYGFTGFLFGNTIVTLICVMAVIRCLLGMRRPPVTVTKSGIKNCIYFAWIWSLFWAICPLLGWSSYGYEPTMMTCTINWQQNDRYYVSYMLCLTTFVFIIPVALMVVCVLVAFKELKKMKSSESSAAETVDAVQQFKGVKMCVWLIVTLIVCWTPYAILCLWVVFLPPETVPVFLSVSPPLFAKLSVVLNPLIIIAFDDSLRRGALAFLLCQKAPPEMVSTSETTRMTSSANED